MSNRNEDFIDKKGCENLQPFQNELVQLTELAGININPLYIPVFVQLLNMNLPPEAVYKLLKLIKRRVEIQEQEELLQVKEDPIKRLG